MVSIEKLMPINIKKLIFIFFINFSIRFDFIAGVAFGFFYV
jgi:hypothetical protein